MSPHRQTLVELRDAVAYCAGGAIEFRGFYDQPRAKHQTLDHWIAEYALFIGRRLSYCVVVYVDCFLRIICSRCCGTRADRDRILW